jgi:hypothetical protein
LSHIHAASLYFVRVRIISCCVYLVRALQVLELTDYDTGLPISRGDIKSFSHRRIRVTYKPKDVGDFTYIVHLQNNFDERNSKSVPFRCIVILHNSFFLFKLCPDLLQVFAL